jgi:UPF0716 protein FxsA
VILFLLFIVAPIAELYTIIQMSGAIGFFNTLGLMIAVGFIGSWLVKREGLRVWRRFNEAVAQGKSPTKEMIDGVLILGAGALLLTPGFLSDVFGLLMLFPVTRAFFRTYLMRRAKKGGMFFSTSFGSSSSQGRHRGGFTSGDFIDTDAEEPRGELD